MFKTLTTLINGANARAEERVRDTYAVELIDQKIRECDAQLRAAKATLATLIQRQRSEERMLGALNIRITDLTDRATKALDGGREDLAREAAQTIATLENERTMRGETLDRLERRVMQLRNSLESGHRKIIDLKQGAIQARAIRQEQSIQVRLNSTLGQISPIEEAQDLIDRVIGKDDPFEQSQILSDINRDLDGGNIADRMADAGFGPSTRTTADDVLSRLKSK